MSKKNKIIIVNDAALDRMEARQKRNKKIRNFVLVGLVIFLIFGGVFIGINFRRIASGFQNKGDKVEGGIELNDAKSTESLEVETESTEVATEVQVEQVYPEIISGKKIKEYNGIITVGDTAYELFTYREGSAKAYAKTVSKIANKLEGSAKVYDMIIPLASGITFPDNLINQIDSTDQRKATQAIQDMMNDKVNNVDIYDSLMKHRTEYIYFRTDHHWTALGAYYAYEVLCKDMGIEPEKIEELETVSFEGFLGSFYKDTKSKALEKNPDVITAYLPKCQAKMRVTPSKGEKYDWDIIHDVNDYSAANKYSTFIASDNPFTHIENQEVADGSSCIVVKESFGNAFVPFLIDHYQNVYVVDYRYWEGDIAKLAKDKKAKDVILLNNLSMIRNQYLVGQLQKVIE